MEKHFFTILFQEKYLSSKKTLRNLYHFKILFTRLHAFKSNKARNEGKGIRKRIQKKRRRDEETSCAYLHRLQDESAIVVFFLA